MLLEGDLIYLLDSKGYRHWLTLGNGMVRVQGLGVVDSSKIIGKEDGYALSIAGKTFTALKPMIADLMQSLERGPQIITPKDAATIVFRLGLRAGETVVEAGVGSGALTMALINSVMPTGKVVSMEFREEFARGAEKNIKRAGLQDYWDVKIGDIRKDNPGVEADAVSLDMPDPQLALDNIETFLRPGGRISAYVPNTNQLADVVHGLQDRNYIEIDALENIQRRMEVHPGGVRPSFENLGHTGYLIFARKPSRN